jgi:hypothetical protein
MPKDGRTNPAKPDAASGLDISPQEAAEALARARSTDQCLGAIEELHFTAVNGDTDIFRFDGERAVRVVDQPSGRRPQAFSRQGTHNQTLE